MSKTTLEQQNVPRRMRTLMQLEPLRTVRFTPYIGPMSKELPEFVLSIWASGATDDRGSETVTYRLSEDRGEGRGQWVIFEGEDYHGSPMHTTDSDENLAGLMGFLTLRKGDTDEEYFDKYSESQIEYSEQHAECLSADVMYVLGEY